MAIAFKIGLKPVCESCRYQMKVESFDHVSPRVACWCETYDCAEKGVRYWAPIESIKLQRVEQAEEDA